MTTNDSFGTDPVARYRYLLRTADPAQIEQAHAQAFAAMTPAERQQVLQALAATSESPADASPAGLARAATRLEVQQPGALERALSGVRSAANSGTATTLLAAVAGGFLGSGLFSTLTGGDGIGGRPGLLSRLFGWRGSTGVPGALLSGGFFGGGTQPGFGPGVGGFGHGDPGPGGGRGFGAPGPMGPGPGGGGPFG